MKREGSKHETWLSTADLAWVVGRTERCIRYWVSYEAVPGVRDAGGRIRHKFRAVDLIPWLQTSNLIKDPAEAIQRLVSLMSVKEVPSQMLVDYVVNARKETV